MQAVKVLVVEDNSVVADAVTEGPRPGDGGRRRLRRRIRVGLGEREHL
jgi:hypothetical protein